MRGSRGLIVAVVLGLVAGAMGPAGATRMTQQCDGPAPTIQSGRATITPGLNALSMPQQIVVKITLFSCSPNSSTRGQGTLKTTIKLKTGQTCALLTHPRTLRATATITWKDTFTSVLALTLALSGKSQNVHATAKVIHGLFKNHVVDGQFHDQDVVSPSGVSHHRTGVAQACANQAGPKMPGRVSISGLTFNTTRPFVIA
jgi:hypothetical protein